MSAYTSRIANNWEELVMVTILVVGMVWTYLAGGSRFLSFFVVLWFVLGIWLYELLRKLPI